MAEFSGVDRASGIRRVSGIVDEIESLNGDPIEIGVRTDSGVNDGHDHSR
jgi:hypothetical protein